jgi:pimeloyl-ACP methyl ester carboxylesterase
MSSLSRRGFLATPTPSVPSQQAYRESCQLGRPLPNPLLPTARTDQEHEHDHNSHGVGPPPTSCWIPFGVQAMTVDGLTTLASSHGPKDTMNRFEAAGRSSQVADGHDLDHYAADAAAVVEHLDLRNAVHIGHSTGGGEVTRYVARHGKGRVAKAVLMSAVPPISTLCHDVASASVARLPPDLPPPVGGSLPRKPTPRQETL